MYQIIIDMFKYPFHLFRELLDLIPVFPSWSKVLILGIILGHLVTRKSGKTRILHWFLFTLAFYSTVMYWGG